jgi:chitinase
MVPYLQNESGGEIVFYDDPESIRIKSEYARSNNLRGIMIWSLGSDFMEGRQPLLDAIGKAVAGGR